MPQRQLKYLSWQQEDLIAALKSVKTDGLSLNAAAKAYGIPCSTLRDKFHGRTKIFSRPGPSTYLTAEEEEKIVDWAIKMGKMGLRQSRADISKVVKTLLDKDGRETPFLNNTPGQRWWRSFVKRHPDLIYRKQQPADKARVMVSDQRIESWFEDFEAGLQRQRSLSMLKEPHRLFEDESKSPLDGILSGLSAPKPPGHSAPSQAQQHSPSTSTSVALDGVLDGVSVPQTLPAQPEGSTSSTPAFSSQTLSTPILNTHTPQTPVFSAQTPPGPEASSSRDDCLVVPIGMSKDQRKKKGLPPPAITVAEFFRYVSARRARGNHEDMMEQRRINRQMELDREEEMEEEYDEDEDAVRTIQGDGGLMESAPQTEQERKKQEAERRRKVQEKRKKQIQIQNNKRKVNQLLKVACEPDAGMLRRQLKEEIEKAKKLNQRLLKEAQKKKEASSKRTKQMERDGRNEESLQKDTIKEVKDKVRKKSNIMTLTGDEKIYICPVCMKDSGDDQKWISCDHCVRWLHLSCTSMHLVRGVDLAGFDYKCKFC